MTIAFAERPNDMANGTLRSIWKAVRQLDPGKVAREAGLPFTMAIVGASAEEVTAVKEFLLGPSPWEDVHCAERVFRCYVAPLDDDQLREIRKADFILATEAAGIERVAPLDLNAPNERIRAVACSRRGTDLRLALASCLPAFRPEIARRIVREVCRENAVFVIATALGDVIPSPLSPLVGIAEAASDTVVLTANQIRMLFMLGAVYGIPVGYITQWREIGSIVGAAFGWRALARELVSKIPLGGGLVPKGAVAYAGTTVIGEGLIFYYTTGRKMTRQEMQDAFKRSYSDAVASVRSLVSRESGRSKGKPPESD